MEGALRQTTPGRVFTLSVLEALPALALPASAATTGMTAARGIVAAKTAATGPLVGALVGPVIGILSGWLGYKVNLENAESPRERKFLEKAFQLIWGLAALFCLGLCAFIYFGIARPLTLSLSLTVASVVLMVGYCVGAALLIVWAGQTQRRIRREEAAKLPAGISPPAKRWRTRAFEYRSRAALLGLPLVHVCLESTRDGKTQPAVGWIAIGNIAYGALFAFGGFAIGAVSVGGVAVGLLAIGGCTLGVFSFGGVALGGWAVGGVALGYMAAGAGAVGWLAASGGAAVAHDFAIGGTAFAHHANDAAARAFAGDSLFLRVATWLVRYAISLIGLPMALVVWQLITLRRNRQSSESAGRG